jgi:hypothetical protein
VCACAYVGSGRSAWIIIGISLTISHLTLQMFLYILQSCTACWLGRAEPILSGGRACACAGSGRSAWSRPCSPPPSLPRRTGSPSPPSPPGLRSTTRYRNHMVRLESFSFRCAFFFRIDDVLAKLPLFCLCLLLLFWRERMWWQLRCCWFPFLFLFCGKGCSETQLL